MSKSYRLQTDRRGAMGIIGAGLAMLGSQTLTAAQPEKQPAEKAASPDDEPAAPKDLITRAIPSTGELLPVIGLGTWQSFDIGSDDPQRAQRQDVLKTFVAMGGKVIDSSPMYGRSEQVVGDLITKLDIRSKLFIATKVWTTGKSRGIEQMEQSEKKLQAKPLDLMQVHNLVDMDIHLATLREWKQAGRIKYVGITHYTASQHDHLAEIIKDQELDFLQINYSVGERDAEKKLLPLAKDRGVAVLINRPFVSGAMFKKLKEKPLPDWAAEIGCSSWAQLMLKFVVSHPAVTCAIPATSKTEHMQDNMKACIGKLPDEAMRARIAAAIE